MLSKAGRKRRNKKLLHYLNVQQTKELKYLVLYQRSSDYEQTAETNRQRGILKLKIRKEAYRYKILEHPENVQKCVYAIQEYVRKKLPFYSPRLK